MSIEIIPLIIENKEEIFRFKCIHCDNYIDVLKININCGIFRHAYFKHNLTPIPPHSTKDTIEKLINTNQIIGCGKPFRLNKQGELTKCDYI